MAEQSTWASMAERGSLRALFMLRRWYRIFGRRASVAMLVPIVTYFFVTGRSARRASLEYLRVLWATPEGRERLGATPRLRHAFRHLFAFAENILDRMILWSGDVGSIQIENRGRELVDALVREGRGAPPATVPERCKL